MSHTLQYPKILGADVRSSNLTPYCHISLPYITKFVSNANHQRRQPTPSHCVSTCGVSPFYSHSYAYSSSSSSAATC